MMSTRPHMKTVRAFWVLLPPQLRRRCLALLGLALVMAATTVAGLVSVMPFFHLLSASEATPTTRWLQGLRATLGIADERVFLVATGVVFVLTLIVANVINYFGARSMHAFALCAADSIRVRLFGVYLRSDYLFHTRHDGARLGNDVLHESDRVAALANVGFQAVTADGRGGAHRGVADHHESLGLARDTARVRFSLRAHLRAFAPTAAAEQYRAHA